MQAWAEQGIALSLGLLPITVVVALLYATGYLAWNYAHGLLGFPLDDAWIHQTYARNLAEPGQLAYLPGQPSVGSTSPAWSFLLSVGYKSGLEFRAWACQLGGVALAAIAWFAYHPFQRLAPRRPRSGHTSRSIAALLGSPL